LVLREGQIIEHGSFKELLAIEDGVFASMWADQVSSDDHPSISGNSIKKEVSGYDLGANASAENISRIDEPIDEPQEVEAVGPSEEQDSAGIRELETANIEEPVESQKEEAVEAPVQPEVSSPASIAFPSSAPESEPVAETPAEPQTSPVPIPAPTPGVTFGDSVNSPPSGRGTPDPDSEPKRKRISSQNFQRLARRISITTRRQNSSSSTSIIPGFMRDQSPRVSTDDASARAEGSTPRISTDSPAGSLKSGDDKGKLKKKDKKEKNKKGST